MNEQPTEPEQKRGGQESAAAVKMWKKEKSQMTLWSAQRGNGQRGKKGEARMQS